MAAFTVSTSKSWDDASFSTRAGADTYTITTGAVLTIDTDVRHCLNSSAATGAFGNITITNGQLFIDATSVRIVPFDAGTGTCPTIGDTLYLRSGGVDVASGMFLGCWDTLASAPQSAGAMVADGWFKFRSLGVTLGTIPDNAEIRTASGGGGSQVATVNGTDKAGWLEIAGVETGVMVSGSSADSGLGTLKTRGTWFEVGTTPATPATTDTYQLPASYNHTNFGGVWVDGVHWPCAGVIGATYTPLANTLATDARGRVCWISTQGLLRFGYDGTNTGGELPPANAAITIPNIILINAANSAGYANVAPSGTLATRYEIATGTSTSYLNHDLEYLAGAWYMGVGFWDHDASHCALLDSFLGGATKGGSWVWTDLMLGSSGYYNIGTGAAIEGGTLYGATWIDITVVKAGTGTAIRWLTATDVTTTRLKVHRLVARTSSDILISIQGSTRITLHNPTVIGGNISNTGTDTTITDLVYCDTLTGTVGTANPLAAVTSSGPGLVFDGLTWLLATANTCHPYTAILNVVTSFDTVMKNIGSAASPLDVGSANATGNLIQQTSASVQLIKLDRIYVTDLRSGFFGYTSAEGAFFNGRLSNVWGVSAENASLVFKNITYRGMFATINITNNHGQPGGHFADAFTSTTAGVIQITGAARLAELPSSAALTITGGTPRPTAATHYMPTVDDQITWKFPYKIRGYTAFNGAPTFDAAFGTPSNFLIEVSLDYGATWVKAKGTDGSTDLGTLDISTSYAEGFPLWVRATTKVSSSPTTTTHGLGRIFFAMTTTATAYVTQYPLEEITFTDSRSDGVTDASVAWVAPGGASVFGFYTGTGTEVLYSNEDGTEKTGTYISRRAGYGEFVGGWTETSSWYLDTKVYFVAQTLIEATIADSGGITFVGDTSATLGADKTFQQLYSNAQHWSCLEANMLYGIPVVSAGNGAYTAVVDVVTTGWSLSGAGSLALGANTLTASVPWAYTYTGGTFSQTTTVPSFNGGSLTIDTHITAGDSFSMTEGEVIFDEASILWDFADCTFSGEITLSTTAGQAVTVAINTPSGFTINNTEPGNITVVTPVVTADISITSMPNDAVGTTRLQIRNTTAEAAAAWQAGHVYATGAIVKRVAGLGTENTLGLYFRAITGGTSGGVEPTWVTTTPGVSTTTDNTVTWLCCAVLYYDADPGATSLTDTYIDGEEFLAGETVDIRFAEMNGASTFKTYDTTVITTSAGFSALVSEEAEPVFATYAIDGSTQDGIFSPNYTSSRVVMDANIDFSGKGAFAYYCYVLTTSEGMARFWGGVTAVDAGNIRINTSILNLYFDESAGFVKQTDDVRIYRDDETRPAIDPTTGGHGIEINWRTPVSVVSTGGSALTPAESAYLLALPSASANATAVVTKAVDGTTTLAESLALSNAVLGGKVSGAGTGTETFRDLADTKDRVVATVDTDGNRTAITRDLT